MKPTILKLVGKATYSTGARDLFWSIHGKFGANDDYATIRWSGYDDANWWDNVSSSDQFIKQTAKNGKVYYLNADTNEVFTD